MVIKHKGEAVCDKAWLDNIKGKSVCHKAWLDNIKGRLCVIKHG